MRKRNDIIKDLDRGDELKKYTLQQLYDELGKYVRVDSNEEFSYLVEALDNGASYDEICEEIIYMILDYEKSE